MFSSNMCREHDKILSHYGESATVKYDTWKWDKILSPSDESMTLEYDIWSYGKCEILKCDKCNSWVWHFGSMTNKFIIDLIPPHLWGWKRN